MLSTIGSPDIIHTVASVKDPVSSATKEAESPVRTAVKFIAILPLFGPIPFTLLTDAVNSNPLIVIPGPATKGTEVAFWAVTAFVAQLAVAIRSPKDKTRSDSSVVNKEVTTFWSSFIKFIVFCPTFTVLTVKEPVISKDPVISISLVEAYTPFPISLKGTEVPSDPEGPGGPWGPTATVLTILVFSLITFIMLFVIA